MINLSKVSVARWSSGITAFVCAGFLAHAIMTDNGGRPDSQERWKEAGARAHSIIDRIRSHDKEDWYRNWDGVDAQTTASIGALTKQLEEAEVSMPPVQEPSVMRLIRENSDVGPGVSSDPSSRVSVLVKEGDTLFAIAVKHGLTVAELARLNALEEPYVIQVGQTLYVAR